MLCAWLTLRPRFSFLVWLLWGWGSHSHPFSGRGSMGCLWGLVSPFSPTPETRAYSCLSGNDGHCCLSFVPSLAAFPTHRWLTIRVWVRQCPGLKASEHFFVLLRTRLFSNIISDSSRFSFIPFACGSVMRVGGPISSPGILSLSQPCPWYSSNLSRSRSTWSTPGSDQSPVTRWNLGECPPRTSPAWIILPDLPPNGVHVPWSCASGNRERWWDFFYHLSHSFQPGIEGPSTLHLVW